MDAVLITLENCILEVITKLISSSKYQGHPARIDLCQNFTQICRLLHNSNDNLPSSHNNQSSMPSFKLKYKKRNTRSRLSMASTFICQRHGLIPKTS